MGWVSSPPLLSLLYLTFRGMLKAILSKLHLAFDLMFTLCFRNTHFQQETASRTELKPEEKPGDFQMPNSCSWPV